MASTSHTEAAPSTDLTAFQRDLLAVVHDAEPGVSGLAIKDVLDEIYQTDINHGRLYPNLDTLVDMGLVSKGKKDDRTNTYDLTARGERELRVHVSWFEAVAGDLLE